MSNHKRTVHELRPVSAAYGDTFIIVPPQHNPVLDPGLARALLKLVLNARSGTTVSPSHSEDLSSKAS